MLVLTSQKLTKLQKRREMYCFSYSKKNYVSCNLSAITRTLIDVISVIQTQTAADIEWDYRAKYAIFVIIFKFC